MSWKVPESHFEDTHKTEFLCHALVGHARGKKPLSRVATAEISFQQLYAELKIGVQLERKSAMASILGENPKATYSGINHSLAVYFNGQGKFIRRSHHKK